MLQLHNTLSRKKSAFQSIHPNKVGMYVCGVTTYDFCHIGHGRTYVVFDILARYLRFSGYEVNYVRNITDVDDKIIRRANENGESFQQVTERFIAAMHEDFDALGIGRPNIEPRVSTSMVEIIELIERLIERGHAYPVANGDVLFDVSTFDKYGALSQQDLDMLQAGSRVDVDASKDDPLDFVLWKSAKPDEPSWDSPWGKGRPGWHIECSAMTMAHLGEEFDIHGGGSDLTFPHHENEIAQSCCATGKDYAKLWMHGGMVQINSEKMSKSLNNFFTIRDVLKEYPGEVIRFFLIGSQYRTQLNYSEDNLNQAYQSLERMYTALRSVSVAEVDLSLSDWKTRFCAAMDDDLNVPEAMAVLFDLVRELNRAKEQGSAEAEALAGTLKQLGAVLGILQQDPEAFLQGGGDDDEVAQIEALITKRAEARANKDWAAADEARDALNALNVELEDGANGTTWRRK
ncbi:cysteine--tRNA ligase [Neiella marina]|uniref:Cysteine--tRNA ligase n=1 Tax=Neiella holothuriorum TaxID=2870530 RepID=A0ABS7EFC5_9GAMM|nr:cysteine--tRNA ligase [Neiella holothuriorum]MBW8190387.1 cysteine--tRNA ligase [Neiella holothuriorum]